MRFVTPEQAAPFPDRELDTRRRYTDRLLAGILAFQWVLLTGVIWWLGPRGAVLTPALRCALVLGCGLSLIPIALSLIRPGLPVTRHLISGATMLSAVLSIHLTSDHISGFFPLYAALAIISLYLDDRVFSTAWGTLVALCALSRFFWPLILFGPAPQVPQHWLEPLAWLVTETAFLLYLTSRFRSEHAAARSRASYCEQLEARLQRSAAETDRKVQERTNELRQINAALEKRIEETARIEEMLHKQTHHDSLTGLPSRTLFTDFVEQAIATARVGNRQIAVLYIDIDRFKVVNDSMGHSAGDKLLIEVADRLKASLRAEDTVARMGGDEFTVLLPGLPKIKDADKVARKLLDTLGRPFQVQDHEMFFTASIGISIFPDDARDAENLTKFASIAMQRAKEESKGSYQHYAEPMIAKSANRFALEGDLRKAQSNEELLLFYQAQVGIKSGNIGSVETLVRWRHPERGLVPPGNFISVAEDTGLIIPMGEWILRTAAHQAAHWYRAGRPLRVSVNISARQFEQRDLIHMVGYILRETGLPPDLLELELTESCIMDKGTEAVKTLEALKGLGVRLAIDDFGTGYSSLAYLRRFPMDVLKIDRSFVQGLESDKMNVAIVRAVSDLAHAVGLEVVAEGVETTGQEEILRTLNCDLIQGYLYSRPLPLDEFEELVAKMNGYAVEAGIGIERKAEPLISGA